MSTRLICVTGAGGLIGRAVAGHLARRGAQLSGLVAPASEVDAHPGVDGRWTWGDVLDPAALREALTTAESVVHLAGPPSVAASFATPETAVAMHAAGTAAVFRVAAEVGTVRRVVLVSTAEVYGIPRRKTVRENHPLSPLSPYAAAKLGAEAVATTLSRAYGIELVIVRPFAVYGPESPRWSLVGSSVDQALRGTQIAMADLGRVRDLVHVDDIADLLARCATTPLPESVEPVVVNAATGVGTSIHELALAAARATGRDLPIVQRPPRPTPTVDEIRSGARPPWSDPMRLVGDPRRARDLFGWMPAVSVDSGLLDVVHRSAQGAPA